MHSILWPHCNCFCPKGIFFQNRINNRMHLVCKCFKPPVRQIILRVFFKRKLPQSNQRLSRLRSQACHRYIYPVVTDPRSMLPVISTTVGKFVRFHCIGKSDPTLGKWTIRAILRGSSFLYLTVFSVLLQSFQKKWEPDIRFPETALICAVLSALF